MCEDGYRSEFGEKAEIEILGEHRRATNEAQSALEPVIAALGNMISTQTTSARTHDLERLIHGTVIWSNVQAAKSLTFETMAEYIESYAQEMGVLLLNI